MDIRFHSGLAVMWVFAAFGVRAQLPPVAAGVLPASASISGTVVRAADDGIARGGLVVVTQLHARICALLCVTTAAPQSVSWFTDAKAWQKYIEHSGAHINGKGVSALGEIAVLADAGDEHEPLSHELVHQVLKGTSKAPLPLWFEEGSAACFGWMAAKSLALANRPDRPVVRMLPAMERHELLAESVLLGSGDYPQTEAANRAFYRQAEELVRLLYEQLGAVKFRALTVALAKKSDLRVCLGTDFGYSDGSWMALVSAMRARAMFRQQR